MPEFQFTQNRKAPTKYWEKIYRKIEELCEEETDIMVIYKKLEAYRKEVAPNSNNCRITHFRPFYGFHNVISLTHGTSNGGDQLGSISIVKKKEVPNG